MTISIQMIKQYSRVPGKDDLILNIRSRDTATCVTNDVLPAQLTRQLLAEMEKDFKSTKSPTFTFNAAERKWVLRFGVPKGGIAQRRECERA